MTIPSRQIGWTEKTNTLWRISKKLEELMIAFSNIEINPITTTTTLYPSVLTLKFGTQTNANILVGDSTNVTDWNDFFDLPTNGSPFNSVEVSGTAPCTITLHGGKNIKLKDSLFKSDAGSEILEIIDNTNDVIEVGTDTFAPLNFYCKITKAILPAVTKIGARAFSTCAKMVECDLRLITKVEAQAFYICQLLETVNFSNVEIIEYQAFMYCGKLNYGFSKLTTLNGYSNFYGCTLFTGAGTDFSKLTSVGSSAFSGADLGTCDFSNLETVGDYAFSGNEDLTVTSFPKLKTIGTEGFSGCSLLNSDFPVLETIGDSAFWQCYAFINKTFPSVITVHYAGFGYCTNMTSLSLPVATSIHHAAFGRNFAIQNCSIPSCTTLGEGYNNVWYQVAGNTITLTIPLALVGHPEVTTLQASNTVTIVTV